MTTKRLNPRAKKPTSLPLTARKWLGVLAVFLGLMVQTAHTHRGESASTPQSKGHVLLAASDSGTDLCPLCVAMHSASPAQAARVPAPPQETSSLLPAPRGRFISAPPAFTHDSRPPPPSTR